jgi:hypothetical protein
MAQTLLTMGSRREINVTRLLQPSCGTPDNHLGCNKGTARKTIKVVSFLSVTSLTCDLQICKHFNKLNEWESTKRSLLYDSSRLHLEICYAVGASVFVASLRRQLSCDVPCDKGAVLRDMIKGASCIVVLNPRTQGNIFSDWLHGSYDGHCSLRYICYKGRPVAGSDLVFKRGWKSQYSLNFTDFVSEDER